MSGNASFQTIMLKYNKLARIHYNREIHFKIKIDSIEFTNSKAEYIDGRIKKSSV